MRKAIFLGLFVVLGIPAEAAHRTTVTQLEQMLASDDAAHRADADVARQMAELELTERLTDRTLDHFATTYKLGPHSAVALQLLSDQSAFLDPPASEMPATAQPDAAEQQRMLAAAQAYAVQTWTRMPNFLVTRTTHRFDDAPHVMAKGDWPVNAGLQLTGTTTRQVTFSEGKEVVQTAEGAQQVTGGPEMGLSSWGEFGPALSVVLADAAKHRITFSHWEQTPTGIAGVFRYEVPRESSHYAVMFSFAPETVIGRTQFGYSGKNRSAQQVANIPREKTNKVYSETPAYHGTIAIDPATGAVLRITIDTTLSGGDPLLRASTMIEYAPVTIGDRQFICPERSLAISREEAWMAAATISKEMALNGVGQDSLWQTPVTHVASQTVLLINETSFTGYHRFGSTSRILTDASVGSAPRTAPAEVHGQGASAGTNEGAAQPGAPAASAGSAGEAQIEVNAAPAPAEAGAAALANPPSSAAALPVVPEISMAPASGLPDQPTDNGPSGDGGYSLKVTSRLVDVGLVAFDKKGHPVTDLKASDLEIYDNGHKQEIRSFAQAGGPAPVAAGNNVAAPAEEPTFSNRVTETSASAPASAVESSAGAAILLIDENHIAWADMSYARGEILKFLGKLAPGERVGLYSMNGLGFRVLSEVTTDHAALMARMQKFMPSAQSVSEAQAEETRNRQHFDEVHNAADLNTVNGNHTDVPDFNQPIDPQLMTMGDDPARSALVILAQVARHLAAIPGQKKLVWVSSDNVFADWTDQSVGIEKAPKPMTSFVLRAQEAMNEAHASIYPFDVSQLEVGGVSADLYNQSVQLAPASAGAQSVTPGTTTTRNNGPGRIDAAMSQDIHPVQGAVRDVAAATGGRVIRRTGDIAAQLAGIVDDERATYTVSFTPQGPADGQYHKIEVKLAGKRGVSLRYRTGYFFDQEPTTLKERFQRAVWRPEDVTEIAVTATASPESGGANVKVNIAAADLGMEQQAGRWMDKLDIFFIQRDDAGIHAQIEGQTLGLRLKGETYQRLIPAGVPFAHSVLLKPGVASLRVLVVDENSGRMGSVTIPAASMSGAS